MLKKYEVIISGAGPSGSLLAYMLSTHNINTLVLEKENFPRFKICAGGLQHRAAAMLPFNIEEAVEKQIQGIYFSYRSKNCSLRSYGQPLIYTTERGRLDQYMARKALQAGSRYEYGCRVLDIQADKNEIKVKTSKGQYRSKIVVGADGINSAVRQKINPGRYEYRILGYDMELDTDKVPETGGSIYLDVGGVKSGYAWIFPKRQNISVGIGGPMAYAKDIKNYFKYFLDNHAFFKSVDVKNQIFAKYIPIRAKADPLCSNRIILVGDAAGLGDAFTGEGLYNSFLSSIIASESIKSSLARRNFDFNDYHIKITDNIYRDIKISKAFSRLFFQFPLVLYNLVVRNDNIFRVCCKFLRGEKSYSSLADKLSFLKH